MKKIHLGFLLLSILLGCSTDEDKYITLSGRVERELNGEGISNQKVLLEIHQIRGSGNWTYTTKLDSKEVLSDSNGNFNVTMKSDSNTFVSVYKERDENYTSVELTNFEINENILLKVNKFNTFKIYVNNVNPFDSTDYIYINFVSGNTQNFRSAIENFGVVNTQYPPEYLPGGGMIGAHEDAAWTGTNVHSIVYYKVPENADTHKLYWLKNKNGLQTSGSTPEIPFQANQINEFYFDY